MVEPLIEYALAAQQKAYAPYSQFQVGASLQTNTGNIYAGCNVENISFGLTLCAEATAIAHMINAGERHIQAMAIVGSGEQPCFPCGACRQRIHEFAASDCQIHIIQEQRIVTTLPLRELLPYAFSADLTHQ